MLEDFQITQLLGLTSFGALYLATNVNDGNTVAIKEYLPSAIATRQVDGVVELLDPSHATAFQRGLEAFAAEALTLSQYDHPNLLRVSCVWEANGTIYRAMPYLVGSTLLARRSSASAPASQAELQVLLDGLLNALRVLNGSGLAHGQIEPINIFVPDDGHPVLMDFDAVHHAVMSDVRFPYIDAYADPAKIQQTMVDDLHAVAAVLHFAISAHWAAPTASTRYEPLADVLTRLKDSASALGYHPDFLGGIDAALAAAPKDRPRTEAEFRALFEPKPQPVPPTAEEKPHAAAAEPEEPEPPTPAAKPTRAPKRAPVQAPQSEYPLNSSESVLALLAKFDNRPSDWIDDIEPFQAPVLPTLTEEAEPSLPPLRENPFDAMESADEQLPQNATGYIPLAYTPMPRVPVNRWQRLKLIAGLCAVVLACLGALGWLLFA
ncbi:MAG TPA: hypothetical protein VFL64_11905 [Rhizobacter sp.]|nr:hypothetical protein [Rhizobacter sp.]